MEEAVSILDIADLIVLKQAPEVTVEIIQAIWEIYDRREG